MRRKIFAVFVPIFIALSCGCSRPTKPVIWIYTSMYKDMVAALEVPMAQAFPEATIRWYQAGSEIVGSKLNAEIAAGGTKADLVLTSDPFWYEELKQHGEFLQHRSIFKSGIEAAYSDPEGFYTCVRMPVVVIAYNGKKFDAPPVKSWKDLGSDQWKSRLVMANALESGTTFTATALLSDVLGWHFFEKLRALSIIASGGNSAVQGRIESGERDVGILLLENILKAMKKGSPIRPVYPEDGAIAVPSPVAIMKDTAEPELSRRIQDWFFSVQAQRVIVEKGFMFSVLEGAAPPQGSMSWKQIKMIPWSAQTVLSGLEKRNEIKRRFKEVVLK